MLSPPHGLTEDALAAVLATAWGVAATSTAYRPVGFGSHHWEVVDGSGTRWFVTVDELETKRHRVDEPLAVAFGRLRASLAAAVALREHGRAFVVAPVPTLDGEPVAPVGDRFAVALYPFVDGRSFEWGPFGTPEHRRAMLDLVVAVHTAPAAAGRRAPVDDFAIPHRDELDAAVHSRGVPSSTTTGGCGVPSSTTIAGCGPFAEPAARLLAENAEPVRRLLDRYDELAAAGRDQPSRMVLTHGEPHPGNTMRTAAGWLLIDWDTALVAPPERDLWSLDPGDGSVLDAYAAATGVTPQPAMLQLYRLRWDLADLAVDVARFRRPHPGNADDEKSWRILRSLVEAISR